MIDDGSHAASHSDAENNGSTTTPTNEKSSSAETTTNGESSDTISARSPSSPTQEESRLVAALKTIVVLIFLAAAAIMAAAVFKHATKDEEYLFQAQFEDLAADIFDASAFHAMNVFKAHKTLTLYLEVFALGTGAIWPYVTYPNFHALAESVLNDSSTTGIALQPLILESQRVDWESYSTSHVGWLVEDLSEQGFDGNTPKICRRIKNSIGSDCVPDDHAPDPYYAPVWQVAPAQQYYDWINYNSMDWDFFNRTCHTMITADSEVLSEVTNLGSSATSWPESLLLQPIHKDNRGDSPIVAVLTAIVPWHKFFQRAFPESTNGIFIVVRNTCEQEFTYETNGTDVAFLGIGDLHDSKYE